MIIQSQWQPTYTVPNVSNYICQLALLILYSGVTSQTYWVVSALDFFLRVFMLYRPHTLQFNTFNFLQSKNVMPCVVSKFRKNKNFCNFAKSATWPSLGSRRRGYSRFSEMLFNFSCFELIFINFEWSSLWKTNAEHISSIYVITASTWTLKKQLNCFSTI